MRLVLATLATAAAPLTPQALVGKLLHAPLRHGELPAGYVVASTHREPVLSANAQSHHGVGDVQVMLRGRQTAGILLYAVFPHASDALGSLHDAMRTTPLQQHGAVPGVPSSIVIQSAGATGAVAVVDNVVVEGIAPKRPDAIRLLHAAIAHLRRLAV